MSHHTATPGGTSGRRLDLEMLSTYLDDHVAGATVGLRRVERMASVYRDNRVGETVAPFVPQFRDEREFLLESTEALGIHVSRYKVALAVVAERAGRLKPNGRLLRPSPLSALLEVELLRGAITGKLSGWRSLQVLPPDVPVDRTRAHELQLQAERQVDRLTELLDWLRPRVLTRR